MALKQITTFQDAGGKVNGTLATLASTTDGEELKQNVPWSFSVWFTGLTFTGNQPPTFTIEVSETNDANAFIPLTSAINQAAPFRLESGGSNYKFFRVVYDPQNATGGTKNFELTQTLQ